MINIFKTSKSVALSIDEFFDKIDLGVLNFKNGARNYIERNTSEFEHNLISRVHRVKFLVHVLTVQGGGDENSPDFICLQNHRKDRNLERHVGRDM